MTSNRLIRQFERIVYAWPSVTRDKGSAFGEHTYYADGKVFAYFEGEEVLVLYRTTQSERQELADRFAAVPHRRGDIENRLWWSVQVNEEKLPDLMTYIRRCYERAVKGTHYSE